MNSTQIKKLKHLYGTAKIAEDTAYSINGKEFKFSDDFIIKLDLYLQGKINFTTISAADKRNLEKFIKYADGELVPTDDDYEMFEKFNIYLGSL